MRRLWSALNRWPDGWWGVAWAMALGFAGAAFTGLVLLDHHADYALPMAAAVAVGGGIGQVIRMLWPKKPKKPKQAAWPATTAPPHGRPD